MVRAADYPIRSESYKLKYFEVNELSQNQTKHHSGVDGEATEHQTKEDKQHTRIPSYHTIPMWKLKIWWLATLLSFIIVVVTLLATYFSDNKTVAPAVDPTPVQPGQILYKVLDTFSNIAKAVISVPKIPSVFQ